MKRSVTSGHDVIANGKNRGYLGWRIKWAAAGDALPLLWAVVTVVCLSGATRGVSVHASGRSTPVEFTKNLGQWPDSILYRCEAKGTTVWFTSNTVYYQLTRRSAAIAESHAGDDLQLVNDPPSDARIGSSSVETALIKATFADANPGVEVIAEGLSNHRCNYFMGKNPENWRTDIPSYRAITLHNIYDGVDVRFNVDSDGALTYRYILGPDANVDAIRVTYEGPVLLSTDESDTSNARSGSGSISGILAPPSIQIAVMTERVASSAEARVSDIPGSALVITGGDAIDLTFSTYLGGEGEDYGNGIAVDDSGYIYVAGQTPSPSFPTQDPYQWHQGGVDAFVCKLCADGNGLLYSTFIGGDNWDAGTGIAVDASGSAYVTGYTSSIGFPTHNPYQEHQQGSDAFVLKLGSAGNSLIFSTCLGGTSGDWGRSISVDSAGNVFAAGETYSPDFPTCNPIQTYRSNGDVFVAKLAPAGKNLLYSTFLGGTDGDYCGGVAVDKSGCAHLTGYTFSSDYPTQTPYQTDKVGSDGFVTKLAASGSSMIYSTYLGGGAVDEGRGVALDAAGNAYVTGRTFSTDFPTRNPFQTHQGNSDVFVTKLSLDGRSLVYSTYLGSLGADKGSGIAVCDDRAYITGYASEDDFPLEHELQAYQGPDHFLDAFVAVLTAGGDALGYSTYIGGSDGDDCGYAIAADSHGRACVTGYTYSNDFPIQSPVQTYMGTFADVFVTRLGNPPCCAGVTGNVDLNGIVDLSDLTGLVSYLTGGGYVPACPEEANINTVGIIDISDLSALVSYMTGGAYELPACP